MFALVVTLAFLSVVSADHPAPAYGAPAHKVAHYDETPKPYAFAYGVDDGASGPHFSAKASDDGKAVIGSYTVRNIFLFVRSLEYTFFTLTNVVNSNPFILQNKNLFFIRSIFPMGVFKLSLTIVVITVAVLQMSLTQEKHNIQHSNHHIIPHQP